MKNIIFYQKLMLGSWNIQTNYISTHFNALKTTAEIMKFSKVITVIAVAVTAGLVGVIVWGIAGSIIPGVGTIGGAVVGFVVCATVGAMYAYYDEKHTE